VERRARFRGSRGAHRRDTAFRCVIGGEDGLIAALLGAISEFDKAMTVAKLRGGRERIAPFHSGYGHTNAGSVVNPNGP
jgi:hypothetical protein